jgi:dCTP deaminase
MILSNTAILEAIDRGALAIEPLAGKDPSAPPFNTSAVDLRLGTEILVPQANYPLALDLRKPGISYFLHQHSKRRVISDDQPYTLKNGTFVLGNTMEKVDFPILEGQQCYSARVEGKSSLARCGILVHFTAPTIHAGFRGTITLEMINFGGTDFLLYPRMFICQLIVEEVTGSLIGAPNQFSGQIGPAGVI